MFYKTSLVLLVGLVVAATGRAQTFITGSETVNQGAAGIGGSGSTANIIRATGTSLGGYEFANDITSITPKVGDIVNIVQMDNFTAYNSSTGSQVKNNSPNFNTVVVASQVKITSVAGNALNATVINSQAGVFSTASLNVQHPATWGATNAAGTTFVTPIALYSLNTNPPNVAPGFASNGLPAAGDLFLASQVNQQSVNLTANQLTQGVALYNQVNNGNFLIIDTIPGTTGVGQLGLIQEQINAGTLPTLSAADQAALLTIFSNLDPGNGAFASGFGGAAITDFSPNFGAGTSDSEFTFNLNVDPGNFVQFNVPEPATLSLWGLVIGSGGIGGVIRRYRARWARKA